VCVCVCVCVCVSMYLCMYTHKHTHTHTHTQTGLSVQAATWVMTFYNIGVCAGILVGGSLGQVHFFLEFFFTGKHSFILFCALQESILVFFCTLKKQVASIGILINYSNKLAWRPEDVTLAYNIEGDGNVFLFLIFYPRSSPYPENKTAFGVFCPSALGLHP
jgi:hypothetical protein